MTIKQVSLAAGILLILAIPPIWPYGYYIFLRWVVTIAAVILAYNYFEKGLTAWTFVFGAVAFLFNPIVPVHLNKASWVSIDFIVAILFFVATGSIKKGGK